MINYKFVVVLLTSVLFLISCGQSISSPDLLTDENGSSELIPAISELEEVNPPINTIPSETEYANQRQLIKILEGTDMENLVHVISAEAPGKTVFVIGGIHGDETAGFIAAEQLLETTIKSGTLYILPYANLPGIESGSRRCYDDEDLNRAFPGDSYGSKTEQTANAIFGLIESIKPDIVLDLHEAIIQREDRDFLGNSFIYTSLDGIGDLFFELLAATEDGTICSEPFNFFSPGVPGSLNNCVSSILYIPVITVETYRKNDLETRIRNQTQAVNFVLEFLEVK